MLWREEQKTVQNLNNLVEVQSIGVNAKCRHCRVQAHNLQPLVDGRPKPSCT